MPEDQQVCSFHLRRIGPLAQRASGTRIINFERTITIIGRNPQQVDFVLSSTNPRFHSIISRQHARVIRCNNGYRLYDDSMNGIFINDIKLDPAENVFLNEGDTVTFGHQNGANLLPGTRARQPDSEYQFLFERCDCTGRSRSRTLSSQATQQYRSQSNDTDAFQFRTPGPPLRRRSSSTSPTPSSRSSTVTRDVPLESSAAGEGRQRRNTSGEPPSPCSCRNVASDDSSVIQDGERDQIPSVPLAVQAAGTESISVASSTDPGPGLSRLEQRTVCVGTRTTDQQQVSDETQHRGGALPRLERTNQVLASSAQTLRSTESPAAVSRSEEQKSNTATIRTDAAIQTPSHSCTNFFTVTSVADSLSSSGDPEVASTSPAVAVATSTVAQRHQGQELSNHAHDASREEDSGSIPRVVTPEREKRIKELQAELLKLTGGSPGGTKDLPTHSTESTEHNTCHLVSLPSSSHSKECVLASETTSGTKTAANIPKCSVGAASTTITSPVVAYEEPQSSQNQADRPGEENQISLVAPSREDSELSSTNGAKAASETEQEESDSTMSSHTEDNHVKKDTDKPCSVVETNVITPDDNVRKATCDHMETAIVSSCDNVQASTTFSCDNDKLDTTLSSFNVIAETGTECDNVKTETSRSCESMILDTSPSLDKDGHDNMQTNTDAPSEDKEPVFRDGEKGDQGADPIHVSAVQSPIPSENCKQPEPMDTDEMTNQIESKPNQTTTVAGEIIQEHSVQQDVDKNDDSCGNCHLPKEPYGSSDRNSLVQISSLQVKEIMARSPEEEHDGKENKGITVKAYTGEANLETSDTKNMDAIHITDTGQNHLKKTETGPSTEEQDVENREMGTSTEEQDVESRKMGNSAEEQDTENREMGNHTEKQDEANRKMGTRAEEQDAENKEMDTRTEKQDLENRKMGTSAEEQDIENREMGSCTEEQDVEKGEMGTSAEEQNEENRKLDTRAEEPDVENGEMGTWAEKQDVKNRKMGARAGEQDEENREICAGAGEQDKENGEMGSRTEEQDIENRKMGTRAEEQDVGNKEMGTGAEEQDEENREMGTRAEKQDVENRKMGTGAEELVVADVFDTNKKQTETESKNIALNSQTEQCGFELESPTDVVGATTAGLMNPENREILCSTDKDDSIIYNLEDSGKHLEPKEDTKMQFCEPAEENIEKLNTESEALKRSEPMTTEETSTDVQPVDLTEHHQVTTSSSNLRESVPSEAAVGESDMKTGSLVPCPQGEIKGDQSFIDIPLMEVTQENNTLDNLKCCPGKNKVDSDNTVLEKSFEEGVKANPVNKLHLRGLDGIEEIPDLDCNTENVAKSQKGQLEGNADENVSAINEAKVPVPKVSSCTDSVQEQNDPPCVTKASEIHENVSSEQEMCKNNMNDSSRSQQSLDSPSVRAFGHKEIDTTGSNYHNDTHQEQIQVKTCSDVSAVPTSCSALEEQVRHPEEEMGVVTDSASVSEASDSHISVDTCETSGIGTTQQNKAIEACVIMQEKPGISLGITEGEKEANLSVNNTVVDDHDDSINCQSCDDFKPKPLVTEAEASYVLSIGNQDKRDSAEPEKEKNAHPTDDQENCDDKKAGIGITSQEDKENRVPSMKEKDASGPSESEDFEEAEIDDAENRFIESESQDFDLPEVSDPSCSQHSESNIENAPDLVPRFESSESQVYNLRMEASEPESSDDDEYNISGITKLPDDGSAASQGSVGGGASSDKDQEGEKAEASPCSEEKFKDAAVSRVEDSVAASVKEHTQLNDLFDSLLGVHSDTNDISLLNQTREAIEPETDDTVYVDRTICEPEGANLSENEADCDSNDHISDIKCSSVKNGLEDSDMKNESLRSPEIAFIPKESQPIEVPAEICETQTLNSEVVTPEITTNIGAGQESCEKESVSTSTAEFVETPVSRKRKLNTEQSEVEYSNGYKKPKLASDLELCQDKLESDETENAVVGSENDQKGTNLNETNETGSIAESGCAEGLDLDETPALSDTSANVSREYISPSVTLRELDIGIVQEPSEGEASEGHNQGSTEIQGTVRDYDSSKSKMNEQIESKEEDTVGTEEPTTQPDECTSVKSDDTTSKTVDSRAMLEEIEAVIPSSVGKIDSDFQMSQELHVPKSRKTEVSCSFDIEPDSDDETPIALPLAAFQNTQDIGDESSGSENQMDFVKSKKTVKSSEKLMVSRVEENKGLPGKKTKDNSKKVCETQESENVPDESRNLPENETKKLGSVDEYKESESEDLSELSETLSDRESDMGESPLEKESSDNQNLERREVGSSDSMNDERGVGSSDDQTDKNDDAELEGYDIDTNSKVSSQRSVSDIFNQRNCTESEEEEESSDQEEEDNERDVLDHVDSDSVSQDCDKNDNNDDYFGRSSDQLSEEEDSDKCEYKEYNSDSEEDQEDHEPSKSYPENKDFFEAATQKVDTESDNSEILDDDEDSVNEESKDEMKPELCDIETQKVDFDDHQNSLDSELNEIPDLEHNIVDTDEISDFEPHTSENGNQKKELVDNQDSVQRNDGVNCDDLEVSEESLHLKMDDLTPTQKSFPHDNCVSEHGSTKVKGPSDPYDPSDSVCNISDVSTVGTPGANFSRIVDSPAPKEKVGHKDTLSDLSLRTPGFENPKKNKLKDPVETSDLASRIPEIAHQMASCTPSSSMQSTDVTEDQDDKEKVNLPNTSTPLSAIITVSPEDDEEMAANSSTRETRSSRKRLQDEIASSASPAKRSRSRVYRSISSDDDISPVKQTCRVRKEISDDEEVEFVKEESTPAAASTSCKSSSKAGSAKSLLERLKAKHGLRQRAQEVTPCTSANTQASAASPSSQETPGDLPQQNVVRRRILQSAANVTLDNVEDYVARCKDVLHSMTDVLGSAPQLNQTSRVQSWRKELGELHQKMDTPKTIIAVVGDTGAGKSSLLNALLDHADILPTSGMQACTAVVVEISNNPDSNQYEADIQFLSKQEWYDELKLLLNDLRKQDGKLNHRPVANLQSEQGVAFSKVRAVYGVFHEDDTFEDFTRKTAITRLLGQTKKIRETRPKAFRQKIDHFIESTDKGDGGQYWPIVKHVSIRIPNCDVCSSGATLVDLPGIRDSNAARDKIAKDFLKNCTAVWVVAGIHRAIDDKTAKDLLGQHFRRQLLMDGQYGSVSFVCTKTDQIQPSEIIRANLQGLAEQVNPIEAEITEMNATIGNLKTECDDLHDDMGFLRDEIESLEAENKDLKSGLDELTQMSQQSDVEGELDSQEVNSLQAVLQEKREEIQEKKELIRQKKRERLEKKKETLELEKQVVEKRKLISALCAKARNEYSKGVIRRDFRAGLREMKRQAGLTEEEEEEFDEYDDCEDDEEIIRCANNLKVFCVSAVEYLKITRKLQQDGPTQVFSNETDTNIPALKDFVHEMTSVRQLQWAERVIRMVGRYVADVQGYLADEGTQSSGARKNAKQSFEGQLTGLRNSLMPILTDLVQQLDNAFNQQLQPKMQEGVSNAVNAADGTQAKWGSKVNRENKELGGLYWSTYKATCRRDGQYQSPTAGPIDFNQQLAEPVYTSITITWDRIFNTMLWRILETFNQRVLGAVRSFGAKLCNELTLFGMSADRIQRVNTLQLASASAKLRETIAGIKDYMVEQQREISRCLTPFIQQSMLPAYREIMEERGSGCYARMKMHMDRHVNTKKTFMFDQSSQELLRQLLNLQTNMQEQLQALLDMLMRELANNYAPLWEAPSNTRVLRKAYMKGVLECSAQVQQLYNDASITDVSMPKYETPTNTPVKVPTTGRVEVKTEPGGGGQVHTNQVKQEPSVAVCQNVPQPTKYVTVKTENTSSRAHPHRVIMLSKDASQAPGVVTVKQVPGGPSIGHLASVRRAGGYVIQEVPVVSSRVAGEGKENQRLTTVAQCKVVTPQNLPGVGRAQPIYGMPVQLPAAGIAANRGIMNSVPPTSVSDKVKTKKPKEKVAVGSTATSLLKDKTAMEKAGKPGNSSTGAGPTVRKIKKEPKESPVKRKRAENYGLIDLTSDDEDDLPRMPHKKRK